MGEHGVCHTSLSTNRRWRVDLLVCFVPALSEPYPLEEHENTMGIGCVRQRGLAEKKALTQCVGVGGEYT